MQQKPFPFVLVALTAALGWATLTAVDGWLQVACAVGTLTLAAAAVYQSRPEREPEDPIDEDDLR